MTMDVLNNGEGLGIHRGKLNSNFAKLDSLKLESNQVLILTNNIPFTPTQDYHPVPKIYADALRSQWDTIFNPQSINADIFDRANHTGQQNPNSIIQNSSNRFVSDSQILNWNQKEDEIGVKGTSFNKSFGTVLGTVSEGNHIHTNYEPVNANIQTHITTLTGNPHNVTKSDLSLHYVDNTSDLYKPISYPQESKFTSIELDILDTKEITKSPNGFDRENPLTMGILQYCHSASLGVLDLIDSEGIYSTLIGQTTFLDGSTPLTDRTVAIYKENSESDFSYLTPQARIRNFGLKSLQLPDTTGEKYIVFHNGELTILNDIRAAFIDDVIVAVIVNNLSTNKNVWFGDERHGVVMDGQTHLNLHMTRGFCWVSGCEISGLVDNGTTFSLISSGKYGDEDIKMDIPELSTIPFLYRSGTSGEWIVSDNSDNKLGIFDSGNCCYNEDTGTNWQLSPIGNDYVIMDILATNNKKYPLVKVVGQTLYLTRDAARDNAPAEFYRLKLAGLPSQENASVASIIIHNQSTGQIETGSDGVIWYDCRHGFPMGRF